MTKGVDLNKVEVESGPDLRQGSGAVAQGPPQFGGRHSQRLYRIKI